MTKPMSETTVFQLLEARRNLVLRADPGRRPSAGTVVRETIVIDTHAAEEAERHRKLANRLDHACETFRNRMYKNQRIANFMGKKTA